MASKVKVNELESREELEALLGQGGMQGMS